SSTTGADAILPFRSLKTNCGLKLRFSGLAADAETATTKPETMARRRDIFRTGAPPIHSSGHRRQRFFKIFFTKKVTARLASVALGNFTLAEAASTVPLR